MTRDREPTIDQPVAAVVGGGWREPGSIGGAICRELARRGTSVAVIEKHRASGERTVGLIERDGGIAALIAGDVTTPAGCERLFGELGSRFGRLDVLVNNIGIGAGGSVVAAAEADWDLVLDTNVKSAARACKVAIPLMASGGSIVNISSIAALTPSEHATYTVSKAAIEGLTRAIALYHGPAGIRANAVRVGEVASWRVLHGLDAADAGTVRHRRRARSVLGTEGDSWDVARAVAFLAGDESRWITGQVLTVDGGAGLKRGELWYSDADRVVTPMASSIG
jgi:NAD(P)-dependent dehydrogenase (short-subunit alcohol dehydrogenase family)